MSRLLALLLVATSGCAAPAFLGQTGRVTPQGDVRFGAGVGYQVNTSAASLVRDGRDLARALQDKQVDCQVNSVNRRCWRLEDVQPVARAAMKFALVSPLSANAQVSGRYGFAPGADVGLRWGPGNLGVDVGYQIAGPRDPATPGWASTVMAGWGKRDLGTLGKVIEDVLQGDASMDDFSATWLGGRQFGQFAHAYVGARYIYTRWKLNVVPDLPITYDGVSLPNQQTLLGTDTKGTVQHVGGVAGAALGYKKVFLGAELNVLRTSGKANVLFERVSFDGVGLQPAIYLYGQF